MNIETLHYLLEEDGFWIFLILQFFFPTSSFCLLAGNLKLHPSEKKKCFISWSISWQFIRHQYSRKFSSTHLSSVRWFKVQNVTLNRRECYFYHVPRLQTGQAKALPLHLCCAAYSLCTNVNVFKTWEKSLCGQGLSDTQAVTSVYLSFSPPQTQLLSFN